MRSPSFLTLCLCLPYFASAWAWSYSWHRRACVDELWREDVFYSMGPSLSTALAPWHAELPDVLCAILPPGPIDSVLLGEGQCTPDVLRCLSTLGVERGIQIEDPLLSDSHLALLRSSSISRLKVLQLRKSPVTINGLQQLDHCVDLRVLQLGNAPLDSYEGARLLRMFPRLEVISFRGSRVDGSIGHAIISHSQLTTVNLARTRVDDRLFDAWRGKQLRLESVNLVNTSITDAGLSGWACPASLRFLDVNDSRGVTGHGLSNFLAQKHQLKNVEIDLQQITPRLIETLRDWPPGFWISVWTSAEVEDCVDCESAIELELLLQSRTADLDEN